LKSLIERIDTLQYFKVAPDSSYQCHFGAFMEWLISEPEYDPEHNASWEAIFSLANGYMGIRGYPEEGFGDGATLPQQYVAGVFDTHSWLNNAIIIQPTWKRLDFHFSGEILALSKSSTSDYSRILDLHTGLLTRILTWTSPSGKKTRLETKSFLSWQHRHLLLLQIVITPMNWSGDISITQRFDGSQPTIGDCLLDSLDSGTADNHGLSMTVKTKKSKIRTSMVSALQSINEITSDPQATIHGLCVARTMRCAIQKNHPSEFIRIVAVCSDFDKESGLSAGDAPLARANREISGGLKSGWKNLLDEQKTVWNEKWKNGDVRIDGDEKLQKQLRFNIFHLMQSYRGDDDRLQIGPKLLSGDRYAGHYFWDTDIFVFPFFLFTNPDAGSALAGYRIAALHGARTKARVHGLTGAFYPWESDPSGAENCPVIIPASVAGKEIPVWCGRIELHINAAVVYALDMYRRAVGGDVFWHGQAAPVVLECARFWQSRGTWENGRFEILDVIGPDEYHEHVHNDAYTNYAAAWALRAAVSLTKSVQPRRLLELYSSLSISPEEPEGWLKCAEALELSFDKQLGIIEQCDGFLSLPGFPFEQHDSSKPLYATISEGELSKYQVVKQADVLALFHLFPFDFDRTLINRCWDYYVPRTTHDSSLSLGGHAYAGLTAGRMDLAMEYYRRMLATDLEFSSNQLHVDQGIHAANAGSCWGVTVLGFGGIYCDDTALWCSPRLPDTWNQLSFSIHYKSRRVDFCISEDKIALVISSGPPAQIVVEGVLYAIRNNQETINHTRRNRAVIFDLDGVLVDSADCHYKAWKEIADQLGIRFDREKNHQLKGVSRKESFEILIKDQIRLGEKEKQEYLDKKNNLYVQLLKKAGSSLLLPGVKALLSRLRGAGLKLAVASVSKNAKPLIEQVGLHIGYFDIIIDGFSVEKAKPEPDAYLAAAHGCTALPEDSLVIEDAPAGVEGAIRARMGCIGIGDSDLSKASMQRKSIADMSAYDVFEYFGKGNKS
jgi:beta-phosphoglucomutase